MTTGPLTLRQRKKLRTRLALARAAIRLFEVRGYEATTVDDIAVAADVSRRTFFRYFGSKDEVVVVDPDGILAALHEALAEGPLDEPTIAALRRGLLALTEAYFEPDLTLAIARVSRREPDLLAASLTHQQRWEDALAVEVAADLRVDAATDPRPGIVAHATVALSRVGIARWVRDPAGGSPAEAVAHAFDMAIPALDAILAMPVE